MLLWAAREEAVAQEGSRTRCDINEGGSRLRQGVHRQHGTFIRGPCVGYA